MKIVVLDGYCENPGDLSWAPFEALGEVSIYDYTDITDASLIVRRMQGAEIVITNKTPISKASIEACPDLRYIGLVSTGYNVVDTAAAKERGIPVCNVPAYGTDTVAQFSIALLLEICCHVGHHDRAVHEGRWEKNRDFCFWDYPITELSGKTLGIIGFGRIGQAEGKIARAFGMRVIAYAPRPREEGRAIAEYVPFDTLLAESDFISLHCNLTAENTGIINKNAIAKMREGVAIINTARGQLINEADLAEALRSGKVAAAAVDVVSAEPIKGDNPLLTAPNCIITPHIAWASQEARQRIMDTAAANAKAFLEGHPTNVVNP